MHDDFVMPIGKYRGMTLDKIASTDEGLLYLDWMEGEFDQGKLRSTVEQFLSDPGVQMDLSEAIGDDPYFDWKLNP